jgi:hypothetical protein
VLLLIHVSWHEQGGGGGLETFDVPLNRHLDDVFVSSVPGCVVTVDFDSEYKAWLKGLDLEGGENQDFVWLNVLVQDIIGELVRV